MIFRLIFIFPRPNWIPIIRQRKMLIPVNLIDRLKETLKKQRFRESYGRNESPIERASGSRWIANDRKSEQLMSIRREVHARMSSGLVALVRSLRSREHWKRTISSAFLRHLSKVYGQFWSRASVVKFKRNRSSVLIARQTVLRRKERRWIFGNGKEREIF